MNLVMDVLRILTVRAIRNRTWCGPRVYDSPSDPADLRLPKERAPYIAVYIDDGNMPLNDTHGVGKAPLYGDEPTAIVIIEVNVAGQGENVPDPDVDNDLQQEEADPADLVNTDAGLELRIGLTMRQAVDALCEPDNPWAELWRILAHEPRTVEIARGGSGLERNDEPAIRYASRVMRLTVGTLSEPAPGPLTEFWSRFLDLAGDDDQLKGVAAIIRDFLAPRDVQPWRALQRAGGMTEEAIRGIGLGPVFRDMSDTPAKANNDGVSFIQEASGDD